MTLSKNLPTSSENQSNCFSEDPQLCPVCQGPMCEHDVCINNWCEHDTHCVECSDREWREIEAEDNARYYEGNFE